MQTTSKPQGQPARMYRKCMRATFRASQGEIHLVSHERLDMICPPSIGERPVAGKNGGFWMELRDRNDHVLFHRVLNNPLGDSVEVHSPDGKIERITGEPSRDNVFEVLLPDADDASTIVLMGESLEPLTARKQRAAASRELARFEVPKRDNPREQR
jgi:hypothetical protein